MPQRARSADSSASPGALRERCVQLMADDRRRLRRRLDGLRKIADPERRSSVLATITADIDTAEDRVARRRAAVPALTYPEELPVSQRRDDLLAAIRDHQVVVVAGETGSGKTTQLPKMCLELGRGVLGMVGHTQPRRLAARSVAQRVADELDTELGSAIGYQVRFTERVAGDTLVKVMTDGILLAEIQRDRLLERYDTLIIDEAHERSLNIDFILGYLRRLLPRRPDLKVIITSATIDPERFSRHFDDAPIVEVSGRTYPVDVWYRPLEVDPEDTDADLDGFAGAELGERDQTQGICDAVDELCAHGPGDILVFLSGEREIRDTADAIAKHTAKRATPPEILPLYARLSSAEQQRVFQSHRGRRIILATNVAETSLTVPGIRYVIDPGTARISRYSHRTKVQRLPIERVSQASANQRKGRCGRVAAGVCVRLYSEEDFLSRPEFTDAEILRTNLASVILQMAAARLGDIADFPFVDPPERRNITDGVRLLHELGALDPDGDDPDRRLTPLGRRLAQLPIDPRLGRMILAGDTEGCAREVLVIAAALSVQDPRERPLDAQEAARASHARFADKNSDFLALLNLWIYLEERQRELSGNQFRRMCKREYLNYLRIREWQDIHGQLRQISSSLGVTPNTAPADPERVHRALLAGMLSHVGLKDPEKHEYQGGRGTRFAIFPGSALFKRQPRWVMAAELVETSRLWGRVVARIEPEWAEALAGHLVKRSYSEPHWEKNRGAVMAYERVTLYGLPLVAGRKVNYGPIDPELSRELFIRHALVEGDWDTPHRFFHDNRRLLAEVEDLEHRTRRRDLRVDDDTLFDFYDRRVDAEVVSGRHFDAWWKRTRRTQPDLLTFSLDMLLSDAAEEVSEDDYPDTWHQGELELPLTYQFEPGQDADGVTVHVPLRVLNQVADTGFDWQIPGLRGELVTALIRSLPKPLRRRFVPVPDHAEVVLRRLTPGEEPLTEILGRELGRMSGEPIPADVWQWDRVPDHLRMTFRVVDDDGRVLGEGKDLEELRRRLKPQTRAAISAAAPGIERDGLESWDLDTLPRTVRLVRAGQPVQGYPALVCADDGPAGQGTVAIRVLDTEAEQRVATWAGVRRLLLRSIVSPVPLIQRHMANHTKLALAAAPNGNVATLLDDCLACATDKLMAERGGLVWDAEGFVKLRDAVRADLAETLTEVVLWVERVLTAAQEVDRRLRGSTSLTVLPSLTDIRGQVARLLRPGFVTEAGWRRLPDLVRYLRAVDHRLDKLPENPRRDQLHMAKVSQLTAEYERLVAAASPELRVAPELAEIGWMLEELRVSFFAQHLGTAYPVSEKRVVKAMRELDGRGR